MNIMKSLLLTILLLSLHTLGAGAQDIYMSTSFHEPATEGLRYIYSRDAIHWDTVPGIFLKPSVGT
ncbi:MAG: arabinosidase, partial [Prevotella sp.]|nr:arabinosidase [Prevotella sp.]